MKKMQLFKIVAFCVLFQMATAIEGENSKVALCLFSLDSLFIILFQHHPVSTIPISIRRPTTKSSRYRTNRLISCRKIRLSWWWTIWICRIRRSNSWPNCWMKRTKKLDAIWWIDRHLHSTWNRFDRCRCWWTARWKHRHRIWNQKECELRKRFDDDDEAAAVDVAVRAKVDVGRGDDTIATVFDTATSIICATNTVTIVRAPRAALQPQRWPLRWPKVRPKRARPNRPSRRRPARPRRRPRPNRRPHPPRSQSPPPCSSTTACVRGSAIWSANCNSYCFTSKPIDRCDTATMPTCCTRHSSRCPACVVAKTCHWPNRCDFCFERNMCTIALEPSSKIIGNQPTVVLKGFSFCAAPSKAKSK